MCLCSYSRIERSKPFRVPVSKACFKKVLSDKARQLFNGHARGLLAKKWEQKGAPCKALEAVIAKIGDQNLEVTSTGAVETLGLFKDASTKLSTLRGACKAWNKMNYVTQFEEGFDALIACLELGHRVESDLATLKSVRLLEVRALSGEKRKEALAVRRSLKPLENQGFWNSALTWYGISVLGVKDKTYTPKENIEKALARVESGGKLFNVPRKFTVEDIASDGDKQPLLALKSALDTTVSKLIEKIHLKWNSENPSLLNMGAVPIAENVVFAQNWVPAFVVDGARAPHGFNTWAHPLLFGGLELAWRFGGENFPFPGCSGLLYGIEGKVSVMMLPMLEIMKSGGSANMVTEFLDSMCPGDCSRWLDSRAIYFTIDVGEVAWIPMGWMPTLVTVSKQSVSLFVPYLHKSVISGMNAEVRPLVCQWHEALAKEADRLDEQIFWRGCM
eukprot:6492546-Amphidinium_carterae.2